MKPFFSAFLALLLLVWPSWAQSQQNDDDTKGASGFPLPRFASLHTDEANMRTGPGTRYPIEWVYVREGLPVEITKEFDIWRRIRDWEGSEGWVHKNALTGKRTIIITGGTKDIHKDTDASSPVLAHVEQGGIGRLLSCEQLWCQVRFDNIKGYMPKTDFWGAYQEETFN